MKLCKRVGHKCGHGIVYCAEGWGGGGPSGVLVLMLHKIESSDCLFCCTVIFVCVCVCKLILLHC